MVRPIELVHYYGFAALPQCVIEQHTLPKRNESVLIAMDDQEGRNLLCLVQISNGNPEHKRPRERDALLPQSAWVQ